MEGKKRNLTTTISFWARNFCRTHACLRRNESYFDRNGNTVTVPIPVSRFEDLFHFCLGSRTRSAPLETSGMIRRKFDQMIPSGMGTVCSIASNDWCNFTIRIIFHSESYDLGDLGFSPLYTRFSPPERGGSFGRNRKAKDEGQWQTCAGRLLGFSVAEVAC